MLTKDTIVDLEEAEELEDLPGLRGNFVDTKTSSAGKMKAKEMWATDPLMRTTKTSLGSPST